MIRKYFYVLTFLTSFLFSQVTFSPSILDFGSTSIGSQVSINLIINNNTSDLLSINNISSTDNQFYAPVPVANIPAFGSTEIEIVYIALINGATNATLTLETSNEVYSQIEVPCYGAGASVVTGEVSGIWAEVNSPIYIQGNSYLRKESTLTIEPGVEVIFADSSVFSISGTLIAEGDMNSPIVFKGNAGENNGTIELINIESATTFYGCRFENLEKSPKIVYDDFSGDDVNWNGDACVYYFGHENIHGQDCLIFQLYHDGTSGCIQGNTIANMYLEDPLLVERHSSKLTFDYSRSTMDNNTWVRIYYQVNDDDPEGWIEFFHKNNNEINTNWNSSYTYDLTEIVKPGDEIYLRIEGKVEGGGGYDDLLFAIDNLAIKGSDAPFISENSEVNFLNCKISNMEGKGYQSNSITNINFSTIINNLEQGLYTTGNGFSSVTNSVFYFNDEQNFRQIESNSGILNLEYSNVQGLSNYGTSGVTQGAGNIESNPVFVDNMGRLSENSSCVDAASPWLTDMMMPPGLGTTLADMGAYGGPGNGVWTGSEEIPSGNPTISNIVDIPQDQGGFVGLQYEASIFDYGHSAHDITHYSFWRELSIENSHFSGSNPNFTDLLSINREEYWEHVGEMTAQGFENYGYTAPTLADTNSDGEFISTFIVIAHTADDDVFFISAPASGQSIDNLAPETPMMLSGDFDSGEISLVWSNFVDQDFSYFNLYRNEELYSTVLDSQYVDLEVPNIPELFYSVSAVDHNGNESPVSQEIMVQAHLMGDLNDDFHLNILDVVGLMEYILGFYEIEDLTYADLNEDNNVDILDVISLVTIILDENGM